MIMTDDVNELSHRLVCHWCFYHIYHILTSSLTYYWKDRRKYGIYSFSTMNSRREKKRWHTCLRTAWLFEDLCQIISYFLSSKCYFSSVSGGFFNFFFTLLAYGFSENFFKAFTCSKQNNRENIFKTVSLSYPLHTVISVHFVRDIRI